MPLLIGQYDCVASNKYGTDRSIGLLQVKQGPRFTGPQSTKPNPRVIVSTGEDVELRCQEDSDDILDRAYYWRLNDFSYMTITKQRDSWNWKTRAPAGFIVRFITLTTSMTPTIF